MLAYVRIARPDHWVKNVFVLPGVALGVLLEPVPLLQLFIPVIVGLLSTNAITSANYVINELLDAQSDQYHPYKRFRPAVLGLVTLRVALVEYALLATTGLWLAYLMGSLFLAAAGALLFMGLVYNVKPIRLKDRPYVDILSESVNNPLRLLLGWALVVPSSLPPSSVLLAYLFGGAFLMTVKRLAEFRRISDSATAAQYRASFGYYTENILLLSSLFYASSFAFFMGIFLIKYRIEFVLAFPFFSILFTWYLAIGLKANSVAQSPEQLYREWKLLLFIATLVGILLTLFVVDIPPLRALLEPNLS